jgi:hypothetical protein
MNSQSDENIEEGRNGVPDNVSVKIDGFMLVGKEWNIVSIGKSKLQFIQRI